MDQLYSVAEACEIARIGRTAFYQPNNSGQLTARKRGKRTLVFSGDLQRFLESLPHIEVKNATQVPR
jgi:hypothetical protein